MYREWKKIEIPKSIICEFASNKVDQEVDGKMKWGRMADQLVEKGGRKGYPTERNGRSSCELQGIIAFSTCQWNEWMVLLVFIHSVFCLTTGPKPPPKRCLHIVRSRASSFKWEYSLLSLRSSSSFLCLLPRLLATSISPFIFPSITCFRRQFLRKMWPIQLAFRFLISCRIFLCSLTLSNTSSFLTWSVQLILSILLQHHISKLSRYFWSAARNVQVSEIKY